MTDTAGAGFPPIAMPSVTPPVTSPTQADTDAKDLADYQAFLAWRDAQDTAGTQAPEVAPDTATEPEKVDTTTKPVTEHPLYTEVATLLGYLNLAPMENTFRSVFSWIDAHALAIKDEVEPVVKDAEKDAPEIASLAADVAAL